MGLRQREEAATTADSKNVSLLDEVELATVSKDQAAGCANRESSQDEAEDRQESMSLDGDDFNDEVSATLEDDDGPHDDKGYSYFCYCIKNMTRPVVICMSLIFMKRIALESIVGSTSIVTKNRYGWDIEKVGTLHLVNGIIVMMVKAKPAKTVVKAFCVAALKKAV